MLISFEPIHLYISLVILVIALISLWVRGRSRLYLFFCAVFGIYLIGVVSVVVFPVYVPERGIELSREFTLNLSPFNFGRCEFLFLCVKNILENILLTIPFGFGISFIAKIKSENMIWLAIAVGFVFEFTQLMISLAVRSPFRVVDINDVILNTAGVFLGYGLFRIFGWLLLFAAQKFEMSHKHIFSYVYDVFNKGGN